MRTQLDKWTKINNLALQSTKIKPNELSADRDGNLVDSMLSQTRDLAAAKSFFKQAIAHVGHKPDRVTTNKYASYPRAIRHILGRRICHRTSQYLNNHIEQDHRSLKQRYTPCAGLAVSRLQRAFVLLLTKCVIFFVSRQLPLHHPFP